MCQNFLCITVYEISIKKFKKNSKWQSAEGKMLKNNFRKIPEKKTGKWVSSKGQN